MKANSPKGNENFPHERGRIAIEAVEQFVDATVEVLSETDVSADALESLEASGAELGDVVEEIAQDADRARERARAAEENAVELEEEVEELRAEVDELEAEVTDLEAELREERETRAREAAEDRQRLHRLEEQFVENEAGETKEIPIDDVPNDAARNWETPLEAVVKLPEIIADTQLSENQQRARFVATNVKQFTKCVPAGRAVKAGDLQRILSAKMGKDTARATVTRVIEFFQELGKDSVKVRRAKSNERIVVFDDEFVDRIVAYRNLHNDVVTQQTATG